MGKKSSAISSYRIPCCVGFVEKPTYDAEVISAVGWSDYFLRLAMQMIPDLRCS